MGFGRLALSAAGKVGIVLAVIAAFIIGMLATVYLSLRTAEVKVPDVLGKDRMTAENMLDDVGLKIRVRGARPSSERPDTVLSQLPEAGQIVKVGIPVAVEISRAPKEGESVAVKEEPKQEPEKPAENGNANANQSTATNQNQNQNRSQRNKNKNANSKNANNSNNANSANANRAPNANGNRNANANAPRNTNGGNNRNANAAPNANRTPNNQNANKRAPAATPPPARPAATGTP